MPVARLPSAMTPRLDRHAGASAPSASPPAGYFRELHRNAARLDGIIKMLLGLIFVVCSCGMVAGLIVAARLALHRADVSAWGLAVGIPGAVLAASGLVLVVWGAVKLVSGRGIG